MHADQIIVLDDGKVVQIGSHDELAKVDGIYKQIYEMQGTIESELDAIKEPVPQTASEEGGAY